MIENLVLLPGLLCDEALWAYQRKYLRAKVRIIVPDLTQESSLDVLAQILLKDLPEQFAVAGFSMGGYLIFEFLRQAPWRLQKIAFLNTTYRIDEPSIRQRRLALIELAKMGRFHGVTPQLLPFLVDKTHLHQRELRETIFSMARRMGREAFIRQETAILARKESLDLLPLIRVPTLLIGGQNDQITPPEHLSDMHRHIQGSRLILLENVGHISPLEASEKVTELLDEWLS